MKSRMGLRSNRAAAASMAAQTSTADTSGSRVNALLASAIDALSLRSVMSPSVGSGAIPRQPGPGVVSHRSQKLQSSPVWGLIALRRCPTGERRALRSLARAAVRVWL